MLSAVFSAAMSSLYFSYLPNKLGLIISALIGVAMGLLVIHFQNMPLDKVKGNHDE